MRLAFASLELIFSILIIAIIFSLSYDIIHQGLKSSEIVGINQKIYQLEKELILEENLAISKKIKLKGELKEALFLQMKANDKDLCLYSLKPATKKYKASFK